MFAGRMQHFESMKISSLGPLPHFATTSRSERMLNQWESAIRTAFVQQSFQTLMQPQPEAGAKRIAL